MGEIIALIDVSVSQFGGKVSMHQIIAN